MAACCGLHFTKRNAAGLSAWRMPLQSLHNMQADHGYLIYQRQPEQAAWVLIAWTLMKNC